MCTREKPPVRKSNGGTASADSSCVRVRTNIRVHHSNAVYCSCIRLLNDAKQKGAEPSRSQQPHTHQCEGQAGHSCSATTILQVQLYMPTMQLRGNIRGEKEREKKEGARQRKYCSMCLSSEMMLGENQLSHSSISP